MSPTRPTASVQRDKEDERWKGVPAPQDADGRAGYRMAARTTARHAVITSSSCDLAIPTTAAQTAARSYFYASPALGVNFRFCRRQSVGPGSLWSWLATSAAFPRKRLCMVSQAASAETLQLPRVTTVSGTGLSGDRGGGEAGPFGRNLRRVGVRAIRLAAAVPVVLAGLVRCQSRGPRDRGRRLR